jgi:predicted esterase
MRSMSSFASRCALTLAVLLAGRGSAQTCTPFGDAPATLIDSSAPSCSGGTLLGPWSDPDGTPRWACLWTPSAPASRARPMLVYLHPSLAGANSAQAGTNLLSFIEGPELSGDPELPGFILLAPQGRNTTHHYPAPDQKGTGWDHWYRQFDPAGDVTVNGTLYRENVDAAAIDHFVAEQVASGGVDTQRIYLSGWSNGTSMAYEYALNRSNIAAIAVYSGADPYQRTSDPCPQLPVTDSPANDGQIRVSVPRLPTYQVHNNCDIGGMCPNVLRLESRLRGFGALADDTIVNARQRAVSQCLAACGTKPDGSSKLLAVTLGTRNHIRWPGEWTQEMLRFLGRHPLARR